MRDSITTISKLIAGKNNGNYFGVAVATYDTSMIVAALLVLINAG